MKVLVTGATGFIGSHLVHTLVDEGHSVSVLVRSQTIRHGISWLSDMGVEVFSGDVTKPSSLDPAVREVDVVFHLAALLGNKAEEERQLNEVNVLGTRTILEASTRAGIEKFLFLSTTGVMGRLERLPGKLNFPYNPGNKYELSKCKAEQLVLHAAEEGRINATIVRPTHVYGPREYNTLPIYRLMKDFGVIPLPRGGNAWFQPLYITDLVDLLVTCTKNRKENRNGIYIAGGPEVMTFKEFLKLSAKIAGLEVRILDAPVKLMQFAGWANEKLSEYTGLPKVVTPSRIEFFFRDHVYDIRPTASDLEWFPKVFLKEGLTKTFAWYRRTGLF